MICCCSHFGRLRNLKFCSEYGSLGILPGASESEAFASVVVSLAAGLSAGGMDVPTLPAGLTGGLGSSSGA